MKRIIISICVVLLVTGAVGFWLFWREQRRAARERLSDADAAIRLLSKDAEDQYRGGPAIDLTPVELRARDKLDAAGAGHLTEEENACAVILGFKLDGVVANIAARREAWQLAVLRSESRSYAKANPGKDPFKAAKADRPKPITTVEPCINNLK